MKISQPTHPPSANLVEPALNPTTRADLEKKRRHAHPHSLGRGSTRQIKIFFLDDGYKPARADATP
ncbi:MAG: hypothetical protein RL077_376 [Verrucomicrobiota bacterium]|jgi:hypothetical protein